MSYPRHLPHFDQAVRKGAWNERMVAGEYAVRFPDKVTLGSTVAFRAMRSLSVVGPSSDRIVAHPDITRSSNLNFGAVVLKKRGFELRWRLPTSAASYRSVTFQALRGLRLMLRLSQGGSSRRGGTSAGRSAMQCDALGNEIAIVSFIQI